MEAEQTPGTGRPADLLWTPSDSRVQQSQLYAFMQQMARRYAFEPNWPAMHKWSVTNRDRFWHEFMEYAGIRTHTKVTYPTEGTGMLGTRWFPGVRLNFAEHLLRFDDDRVALAAEDEAGRSRTITYRELRRTVARLAAALRSMGVACGDRVAGYMPNVPEAVMAMLAAASLGAVWSSCSPDFGIDGVFDRFGQITPKVLVTADGYTYAGKPIDSLARVRGIVERIAGIERVVVVPFLHDRPDVSSVPRSMLWSEFLAEGDRAGGTELTFESVPFDHPLYIMYSSGTTGKPKCIVHGHGGTLLQHMKELMLHTDLRREDTIFYFTTCGWMMWNWLVSGLGVGATVVLFEGNPFHPDARRLWNMASRVGVTVFGTSAKYIAACEKAGIHPGKENNLSKLRAVLSTGSPLTVESFRWVYREVKSDLMLGSICGGTDIISCFMLGNPLLPVYAGECQSKGLGMDIHAFNAEAKPVIGEKGELVCMSPFPSQPVGFWNDPDGRKYRAAYFEQYPGVWRHGDFVEITERGGVIVYGRSDATLNPGGVRIGTAEIYREVEQLPEITDSIVVARRTPDADEEVCLFVVLREGARLDDALTDKLRKRIAEGATKRHVPRHIKQVSAIPYTISGKKVELAVMNVIHGEPVLNRDALANPQALDQYEGIV